MRRSARRVTVLSAVLAVLVGLVGVSVAHADPTGKGPAPTGAPVTDFQQDPAHDGVAAGDDLGPDPQESWQLRTPGPVRGPLVSGGSAFIAVQSGSRFSPKITVEALAVTTGQEEWSKTFRGDTPLLSLDGKVLFVGYNKTEDATINPIVDWLSMANGRLIRSVDVGSGSQMSDITASDGLLFATVDHGLEAYQQSSGALAWQGSTDTAWASVSGDTVYAGASPPAALDSFDATTGAPGFRPRQDGSSGPVSPVVGGGVAWLWAEGESTVASTATGANIRSGGSYVVPAIDGGLTATVDEAVLAGNTLTVSVQETATGSRLWSETLPGERPVAPIIDNGYVWVADGGQVTGFDEQTGEQVASLTDTTGSVQVAATDGHLFVAGEGGLTVYAGTGPSGCPAGGCAPGAVGPEGEVPPLSPSGYGQDPSGDADAQQVSVAPPLVTRWGQDLDGVVSYPAADGGTLDVTSTNSAGRSELWAFNESTGAARWGPVDLGGEEDPYSSVVAGDGVAVTVGANEFLLGYSEDTGQLDWSLPLGGAGTGPPQLTLAGSEVVVDGAGVAFAVQLQTGAVAWTVSGLGEFSTRLAYADGAVYLADQQGTEALDAADGSVIWSNAVSASDYAVTGGDVIGYGLDQPTTIMDAATGSTVGALTSSVSALATSGAVVYEQLAGEVVAVDLTGKHRWTQEGSGLSGAVAPLLTAGCLWELDPAGTLSCLDPSDGTVTWSTSVGVGAGAQPATPGLESLATDGTALIVAGGQRVVDLTEPGQAGSHVPGAPVAVDAYAADARATVTWIPPADPGDPQIRSYRVTAIPGGQTTTVPGSNLVATVTGLTDGTDYRFTVTAANADGFGPASLPSTFSVVATAGAPTLDPLVAPAGAATVHATGINSLGEVVGTASWAGGGYGEDRAVTWTRDEPTVHDLGSPLQSSSGLAINEDGDIAGDSGIDGVLDHAGTVTTIRGLTDVDGLSDDDVVLGGTDSKRFEERAVWASGRVTIPTNELLAGDSCPDDTFDAVATGDAIDDAGTIAGVDKACSPTTWSTPQQPQEIAQGVQGAAAAISARGTWTAGTFDQSGPGAGFAVFRNASTSTDGLQQLKAPSSARVTIGGVNDHGVVTGSILYGGLPEGILSYGRRLLYATNLIAPYQCDISDVGAINDRGQALASADCVTGLESFVLMPPTRKVNAARQDRGRPDRPLLLNRASGGRP